MAFLRIQSGQNFSRCGGFLVSKDFVLTAAHCNGDEIMVHLGAHDINNINNIRDWRKQKIPVRDRIPHPQYNNKIKKNDIMLLKLNRNATLNNTVKLIKLTQAPHLFLPGTMCSVAGWGRTSLTHKTNTLREVNLTVMSDQTCKSRYRYYNASSMLCAGDPRDNKTVYQGDSGGSLVCGGVAEGIVSKCINNSIAPPAVYTRISHFLPWINLTMTYF